MNYEAIRETNKILDKWEKGEPVTDSELLIIQNFYEGVIKSAKAVNFDYSKPQAKLNQVQEYINRRKNKLCKA